MQAVEADPAHVTRSVGQGLGPNLVDDRAHGLRGVLGEWHGDEQAPAGHARVRVAPPPPRRRLKAAGGALARDALARGALTRDVPVCLDLATHVARSSRRTCRAASWSRHPTTSTALSSSAL